jgi:imidazoleglycerol-phosphate dehydratase
MLSGRNPHHVVEATFKGLARALDAAVTRDGRLTGVLSTKGTLAG